MTKQKMVGAYIPEAYEHEIINKFQAQFPGTPMTHLVRALLGLWFESQVKLTKTDLKRFHQDARKYSFKAKPIPNGIEGEGWQSAASGTPLLANPYKFKLSASGTPEVDYETEDAQSWARGWHQYFSQGDS